MYVESPFYFTAKNNLNKNQQEELWMIYLKPVNKLMMTSATTKLTPYPRRSTKM